jgi:hypothetical protein
MVERQECPAGRHRGQAGAGECLAELPSELGPVVRVVLSPQDPDGPGELAEPGGGVLQDARVDAPRELGEVAADRLAGQRPYPVAGQGMVEGSAGQRAEGERAPPHHCRPEPGFQAGDHRGMTQRVEERREAPGREGVERVAVGQHRRADRARVAAEHDLADRPACVIADEGYVA